MGLIMEKTIIDLVADFSQWKGDMYRLAALVAAAQKEKIADKLEAAGYPEAAELVRE